MRSQRNTYTFNYEHVLGTSLELQVMSADERAAPRAEGRVLAEVDRLEPILSGWSPASEFARWQATHDVCVPVSSELADVLYASHAWRDRTAGAFDPAAQAILNLLRDGAGEAAADNAMPTLLEELAGPLWLVDRSAGTVRRLTQRAVSLDAIAKGYIVTRAALAAQEVDGITDVLLNIGGDLQHFGTRAVAVGIADPFAPAENAPPIAAVRIENAALATSGGYRRGFVANGRRVSHIVDTRSGRPAERIVSASVFARDCTAADALSTAFSVMRPDESVALADELGGVGCLLIEADGTVTTNTGWDARAITVHRELIHTR